MKIDWAKLKASLFNFICWARTSKPFSWVLHFFIFFIFTRYSGITFAWAIFTVWAVEFWEAMDNSFPRVWKWFLSDDTKIDLIVGTVACILAKGV